MVRIGDGGGSEEGIDPSALQSMISTMRSSAGSALSLVNGYIGQFSRYGLDTGSLTKAAQDLTWAQDQLPMLSRRQSMAQAVANEHPGLTVVDAGAGPLDFPTNAAAQAAGKSAGKQALQALTDHGNDQFILNELQKYYDDPAYLAAFFQALGPQGLAALGAQTTGYQQSGQAGEYQQWATTVGDAFATASFQMPYSDSFLNDLHLPGEPMAGSSLPELSLIAPFLDNGVYSPTWLSPLGKYALQQTYIAGQEPGTEVLPGNVDPIWTAISHNPAFDAQFYNQNFENSQNPRDSISAMMTNPAYQGFMDSAFAGLVQAATVPPQGVPDITPWAANAQLTVRYFGDSPDARTTGDVRQALGEIAMSYFDDMYNTVGAAAPGIGANGKSIPGLNVTATTTEWGNFLDEIMRDQTAAARFLSFYSAWHNSPANLPDNLSPWANEQVKLMGDFVVHQYQASGQQAGTDPSQIADIVAEGGSAFLASLAFGPEAGVVAALLEGGKDMFQAGVKGVISDAFGSDGSQLANPVPPEAIQQITQADSNWETIVRKWYNSEGGQPAQGVQFGGETAQGSPQYYIDQFGGSSANFLDSQGQIRPLSEIQSHPAQLAAYNAWLQSGAIAEAPVPGTSVPGQGPERLISVFNQQASDSTSG